METVKCKWCKKEITEDMEIEYSTECTEYFCSPNCAMEYYFERMGSSPIDKGNLNNDVEFIDGKLYFKES